MRSSPSSTPSSSPPSPSLPSPSSPSSSSWESIASVNLYNRLQLCFLWKGEKQYLPLHRHHHQHWYHHHRHKHHHRHHQGECDHDQVTTFFFFLKFKSILNIVTIKQISAGYQIHFHEVSYFQALGIFYPRQNWWWSLILWRVLFGPHHWPEGENRHHSFQGGEILDSTLSGKTNLPRHNHWFLLFILYQQNTLRCLNWCPPATYQRYSCDPEKEKLGTRALGNPKNVAKKSWR